MTRRWLMAAGLLIALLATPALAGKRVKRVRAARVGIAAPAQPGAARGVPGTPAQPGAARGVSETPAHPGAAARTLDDIHIEGEIPVPQVLFITARDQRRFLEFQDRRYRRTSRKIGEDTVLPSRIVVTGARPNPEKETSR